MKLLLRTPVQIKYTQGAFPYKAEAIFTLVVL